MLTENKFVNGEHKQTVYTGSYDAGVFLDEEKQIALQIVMDHKKKELYPLYKIKYHLGLLGPDDLDASALVTLYLINFSSESKKFRLNRFPGIQDVKSNEITLPPKKRIKIFLGERYMSNYAKGVMVEFLYQIDNQEKVKKTFVPRITKEQHYQYYGKNGKRPYPWVTSNYHK